jgi:hypothetical protein
MNVAALWVPLCMEPDEWVLWQAGNARVTGSTAGVRRADRPCEDCPMGYAADMRAEGRCNGEPAGVDQEEEHMDNATITRIEQAATTKVRVALVAPCGGCTHAPVCRLRESVTAIEQALVAVPKLEDGLAVELRGTITCDWFVKAKAAPRADAPDRPKREMTPEQREAARERMLHARAVGVARKAAETA